MNPILEEELRRQAEVDALVESFVAEGDRDPDSVAAKVEAERARQHAAAVERTADRWADDVDERGTGPDRYPTILRDDRGRIVDVG